MGNVGYFALLLALCASLYSAAVFAVNARNGRSRALQSAKNGLIAVAGLVSISIFILLYAIFTHNFQFDYVSTYTSLNTPPLYLFSALWAGDAGSLLFWCWLLSIFSLVVLLRKQWKNSGLMPYAAMVLMATEAFFLVLLVAVTNPFRMLASVPPDGLGLNPMLQNVGMLLHPPALLAGYVGFTIPFAFAVSSMLKGKSDNEWLAATRRWMLLAWLLLGVGNLIGAWWAYVELGWGGYWAWDPVENAGLMPWLVATAFLHSAIMQRRSGTFKAWNLAMVILTFSLVIFGTFLTRSGILSSVHTFSNTGMTAYFLPFIAVVFLGGFGLLYYRYDRLKTGGTEALVSRESTFLLNNVLLIGTTFVIMIGTMFPTITQGIRGVTISLDASFFNRVVGPLFLAIVLLAGICAVIGWRKSSIRRMFRRVLFPLVATAAVAVILFIFAVREAVPLIAFIVCAFVLLSIFNELIRGARARHRSAGDSYATAWWKMVRANSGRYGGYIVHAGIVLIAVGVIGSSFFSTQTDGTLQVGHSLSIRQYTVTFNGLSQTSDPDRDIYTAQLSVFNSGHLVANMVSRKYLQTSQQQAVTEVGIRSTPLEDLYVILEGWADNGATADFKVLVNPLVIWIWIGGGVFLLGGLIAFWPRQQSQAPQKGDGSESDEENRKLGRLP